MARNGDEVVTARLTVSNWLALLGLVCGAASALGALGYSAFLEHDRKLVKLETQMEQLLGRSAAVPAAGNRGRS